MAGGPLSEASLASHLELSPPTIKSYLRRLADFYLVFKVLFTDLSDYYRYDPYYYCLEKLIKD